MFLFVIKNFGFLKSVPGLAILFDNYLKIWTLASQPALLDWIDEIAAEASKWDHTRITTHKYGGLQFNYQEKEIGHIHSNGLLDMLLSRKVKNILMEDGRINNHHSFKNTGWISFYIKTANDKAYAVELLKKGYLIIHEKCLP